MPQETQVSNLLDLKIIKDGKQVDTSAIDNYDSFMAYLMQASVAANTVKIRKYYEDRTSIGKVQNFPLDVTPTAQEIKCYPSQSIYVVNDGPGEIFITLNDLNTVPTHLLASEALSVDFETHELKQFYVWSAAGTISTARAVVAF